MNRGGFEAYARKTGYDLFQETPGYYVNPITRRAWEMWKAALAAAPTPPAWVPEGWKLVPVKPTEEMIRKGSGWVSPDCIYEIMVEEAPTPPACEKCNGKGEVDSGGNLPWGEQALVACPACSTPPAQDDEPVGYVSVDYQGHMTRNKGKATLHKTNPNPAFFIGVYTRPDASELRKAAEEFIEYFNPGDDNERSLEQVMEFIQSYEDKLRAALNKGKS